jgi:hypothetical protein
MFKSKTHELVICGTDSSRGNNKRMFGLQESVFLLDQEVHSLMESTVSCEGEMWPLTETLRIEARTAAFNCL